MQVGAGFLLRVTTLKQSFGAAQDSARSPMKPALEPACSCTLHTTGRRPPAATSSCSRQARGRRSHDPTIIRWSLRPWLFAEFCTSAGCPDRTIETRRVLARTQFRCRTHSRMALPTRIRPLGFWNSQDSTCPLGTLYATRPALYLPKMTHGTLEMRMRAIEFNPRSTNVQRRG